MKASSNQSMTTLSKQYRDSHPFAGLASKMASRSFLITIFLCGGLFCLGCGDVESTSQTDSTSESLADDSSEDGSTEVPRDTETTLIKEREFGGASSFSSSDGPSLGTKIGGGEAISRVETLLRESLQVAPTSVIWVIDRSQNAESFNGPLINSIRSMYSRLASDPPQDELSTAIVAVAEKAETIHELDTDLASSEKGFDRLQFSDQPQQRTLTAISESIEQIGKPALRKRNQVFIICLTNETPSDPDQLDATVVDLQQLGAPLYVIGIAAPFGRHGTETMSMNRSSNRDQSLSCGPESPVAQRIQLDFPPSAQASEWLDSGFGEWSLERACRTSGGRFLIVRDLSNSGSGRLSGGEWPRRSAPRFSDSVMAQYRPSYSSLEEEESEIAASKMRQALVQAAALPRVDSIRNVTYRFDARDQTRLTNALTRAQREPARVLPKLELLVNTLLQGEIDRGKETDRRWQAAYDLALGRALAAHTRADGYNVLLADLKQGKSFSDPESDSWIISQTEEFKSGGSSLKNGATKARQLLQKVIDEHPDTPWAYLAEQELSEPIAWVWSEANRE